MAADIFNRDIEVSNMEHASTLGACAVGLKYLGQIASLEKFSQPQGKIISPIAQNVEKFAPRFLQYLDCYNQK